MNLHLITTSEKTGTGVGTWMTGVLRLQAASLIFPLALMDLIIRRKRGQQGSRGRSRRMHSSPVGAPKSQPAAEKEVGREGGSRAQCDPGLGRPARGFPTEKSTLGLKKDKERAVVPAP